MRSGEQDQGELEVLVIGSVNTDYLITTACLPRPGETTLGDAFQEGPGGKGANQAVAAARLGARTALIARVGADERGRRAIAQLGREHVGTEGVLSDESSPTGAALIMVMVGEHGEKQILVAPGANGRLTPQDLEAAEILFARAKAVLIQLEIPLETAIEAAHLGRAAGARVVLDPAPAMPLPEELLRDVHVLRPNAAEAAALTGLPVEDQPSARHAAQNLIARGAGAVLVGAPGGNLLVSDAGDLWLPHLPMRAVDATGAGDACAAALAVALAEGRPLPAAARFAHTAAALATTRLGAQAGLPRRPEVLSLMRETGGALAGNGPSARER